MQAGVLLIAVFSLQIAQAPVAAAQTDRQDATTSIESRHSPANDPLAGLNQAVVSEPNRIEIRFERAKLLEERGRLEAAMKDYRWVLDHYPERPEAYNNAARLRAMQGKFDEAIALLEQGMSTNPIYRTMLANLREIYNSLARHAYQSALREPRSAEDILPFNPQVGVELQAMELNERAGGSMVPGTAHDGSPGDTIEDQSSGARPDHSKLAAREE